MMRVLYFSSNLLSCNFLFLIDFILNVNVSRYIPCKYLIDVFWPRYYGLRAVYYFNPHGSCVPPRPKLSLLSRLNLQSTNTDEGRTRLWVARHQRISYGRYHCPCCTPARSSHAAPRPFSRISHVSPSSSTSTPSYLRYPPTPQPPLSRHSSPLSPHSLHPAASAVSPHPRTQARLSHVRWYSFRGVTLRLSGAIYRGGRRRK